MVFFCPEELFETKYSRMDQVKFVKDSLFKTTHSLRSKKNSASTINPAGIYMTSVEYIYC